MKKSVVVLALALSFQGFAQNYTRITKDGSETGYNTSTIHVDILGNASFLYSGPGYEKAFIAFAPLENMVYSFTFQERAVGYALDQIKTGKLRGSSLVFNDNGMRFKLRWKADRKNINNTKITMRPLRSKGFVQ